MKICPMCGAPVVIGRLVGQTHSAILTCTRSTCGWSADVSRSPRAYPPERRTPTCSFMTGHYEERARLKEELRQSGPQYKPL